MKHGTSDESGETSCNQYLSSKNSTKHTSRKYSFLRLLQPQKSNKEDCETRPKRHPVSTAAAARDVVSQCVTVKSTETATANQKHYETKKTVENATRHKKKVAVYEQTVATRTSMAPCGNVSVKKHNFG